MSIEQEDGDIFYPVPKDYAKENVNVEYGKISTESYYSTTTNTERKVAIVLPPRYCMHKTYPVYYMFHGLGQDETNWIEGRAHIIYRNMVEKGLAKDAILVLPNCRARADDRAEPADVFTLPHYRAFDNFINDLKNDLMPYIKRNYSVSESREDTYLCGLSMGGRTAIYIGLNMPETFGAIGAFCPAPGLLPYTMNGVTENGLFTRENFRIKKGYENDTLLLINAGKDDRVVFDVPESYHVALKENGVKHIWYKSEGGHDYECFCHGFYNFVKTINQK